MCYGFSGNITNSTNVHVVYPPKNQLGYSNGRYPEGTTVQYGCVDGYSPIGGNSMVQCTSDGSWKPSPPSCASKDIPCHLLILSSQLCLTLFTVSCQALVVPNSNGTSSSLGTEPGITVTIACKSGYELKGSKEITCQVDGTWTDEAPKCSVGKLSIEKKLNSHLAKTLIMSFNIRRAAERMNLPLPPKPCIQ